MDVDTVLADTTYVDILDLLQQFGVDDVEASNFVNVVRRESPTTFAELFGTGHIVEAAAHGKRRPHMPR